VDGRDLEPVVRLRQDGLRCEPHKILPMGTRIRFLEWVPYQGFGTPSFYPPFGDGNLLGHGSGGRDR
jgi:hypothetical protein